MTAVAEPTEIVRELTTGNRDRVNRLAELVYDDLHRVAEAYLRRERVGHTLRPTALVHEAFLRLIDQRKVDWRGRSHFVALGAQAMRRILVDYARAKSRKKRSGDGHRVLLTDDVLLSREREEDVLGVDEALNRLAELNPLHAQIVEMRFFGGMSVDEVAEALGMSKRAVERQWTALKAWLRREFEEEEAE